MYLPCVRRRHPHKPPRQTREAGPRYRDGQALAHTAEREPSSTQQKQTDLWSSQREKEKVKTVRGEEKKKNYAHDIWNRHVAKNILRVSLSKNLRKYQITKNQLPIPDWSQKGAVLFVSEPLHIVFQTLKSDSPGLY